MSNEQLRCFLIGNDSLLTACGDVLLAGGHVIAGIIADAAPVTEWARGRSVPVLDPASKYAAKLQATPFDYLLSIANLWVVPGDALRCPRKGAINFHEAPLPDYAGVNTPIWALVNGEERWGITWHVMTTDVDAGDMLLSTSFPISADETAVSLNTKCFAAGLETFPALIDSLVSECPDRRPQGETKRYYGKHQRMTAAAAIDWNTTATEIEAMVRALDCGRYVNPMAVPLVQADSEPLVVARARLAEDASDGEAAGTVLAASADGIDVATGRGTISLLAFTTQSGQPVSAVEATTRYGFAPGTQLRQLTPSAREYLAWHATAISKAEPFWIRRLAALEPLVLPSASTNGATGAASVPLAVPDTFREGFAEDFAGALVAAYSVYLGRLCRRDHFDLAFIDGSEQASTASLGDVLATAKPFAVSFDPAAGFAAVVDQVRKEIAGVRARAPYLRDVVARRPELRSRAVLGARDPLSVGFAIGEDVDLAEATGLLTLAVGAGNAATLWYQRTALSTDAALALAADLAVLLTAVATDPMRPIAELEFSAGAEGARAFWNDMLSGVGAPINVVARPFRPATVGAVAGQFESTRYRLSRTSTEALRRLAADHDVALADAVKAAWAVLLAFRGGRPNVVFGVAGENGNPLPLRLACDDDRPLAALLAELRLKTSGIRSFEDTSLADVLAVCDRPADSVLFETIVATTSGPDSPNSVDPSDNAPLVLVVDAAAELGLTFRYDKASVRANVVDLMADHLVALLNQLPVSALSRVADLPRHSEREKQMLLDTWNDTAVDVPATSVHGAIEEQVGRTPDAIAITCRGDDISYHELNRRANLVATVLRNRGVGRDVMVGVFVERGLEMVIGMLGILKAGGAYVPMDPLYPGERLAMMLEDSKAPVILTLNRLVSSLPPHEAAVIALDSDALRTPIGHAGEENAPATSRPEDLAYVIFTSGSTGRPKGVQIEHRNVINFFAGMDKSLGHDAPGVWLAVTSISFDISVLELLWTLARGFKVVLQEEPDRAPITSSPGAQLNAKGMEFSLFYFASDAGDAPGSKYRLLLEGAKYADKNGFAAIWTPERHFHAFGGLYPNPALTSAAIAVITERIHIRAGSVVLPLHNPIRAAEDWSVVDNLSGGRVGLSFASGWHAADFALAPGTYENRRELMAQGIETVRALWRGESVATKSGDGKDIRIKIFPQPIQREPRTWVAASSSPKTFEMAGRTGSSILTNLLSMQMEELVANIGIYRAAWKEAGFHGQGHVSLMLHTFVGTDLEEVRRKVRTPFLEYLKSSTDLVSRMRWDQTMFARPDKKRDGAASPPGTELADLTPEETDAIMAHAFDRYFKTAGLFGTPESCMEIADKLRSVGVDEIACLIDFGVDEESVLKSLEHLNQLRKQCLPHETAGAEDYSIPAQIRRHRVTHMQCTPSMARILVSDGDALESLRPLKKLLLGGEALPSALAAELGKVVSGEILNMYGPTETTVWSTTARVLKGADESITIGRPIANTQIFITDTSLRPCPVGASGEILIGGAGVVRGYLDRPDLTAEKFVPSPFSTDPSARLYRTGDLGRWLPDGAIEFAGRVDYQVKIRGHRVELGEIEAVIGKHPGVRACAVVLREDTPDDHRIVGYVVPREHGDNGASTNGDQDLTERTAAWQKLWDDTYRRSNATERGDQLAAPSDPTFDITGWLSGFDGAPIPAAEMREWVDRTTERILALTPRRVLEIGCGTGMFLYRVAPHCEHYCGVDFSPAALGRIAEQLGPMNLPQVSLREKPADDFTGLEPESFDTVVVNSVIQYFPNVDYLVDVIGKALAVLEPGGKLFIGDVRSLPLLEAFSTAIELHQATDSLATAELEQRIKRRVAQEGELLIDPAFFHALPDAFSAVGAVAINLKRGQYANELTRFRYDVVVTKGPSPAPVDRSRPDHDAGGDPAFAAGAVSAMLEGAPPTFVVANVLNRHVAREQRVARLIASDPAETHTVADLRAALSHEGRAGCSPEDFFGVAPDYHVDVTWAASGAIDCFDVVFRHRTSQTPPAASSASPAVRQPWATYANEPGKRSADASLLPNLRAYARNKLPDFMVPTAMVVLDALPLTPNGKIDRKALPAPDRSRQESAADYQAPTHDLERVIAEVWQDLLSLSQVSTVDNLFDLGANSLLMVQANGRLRGILERDLSLVDMFQYPTVKSLAAFLAPPAETGAPPKPDDSLQVSQERGQSRREALQRRREGRPGVRE